MKLTQLEIHKYRAIRPGTKLVFNDGIHLLLGRNGTGKTTLLDLVAMIFGCNFQPVAREEFSLTYQFAHVFGTIVISLRNWADVERGTEKIPSDERNSSLRINNLENASFRYELHVTLAPNTYFPLLGFRLKATNASTIISYDDGTSLEADLPVTPFPDGNFLNFVFKRYLHSEVQPLPDRKTWRFPRGISRLDECTEWFHRTLAQGSISRYEYFDEWAHNAWFDGAVPESCPIEVAASLDKRTQTAAGTGMSFKHDELTFLQRAVEVLGYKYANLQCDFKKASLVNTVESETSLVNIHRISYGNFRFLFVKHDGSRIPHEDLSFGEKRLLSFYYYLATYEHVLVADELANGMHHDMIDRCLDAMVHRQVFLSTQNPLLLDHIGFSSADEVRTAFILCHITTERHQEQMVLRNMESKEAAEFFADYKVGIQHVNEVLRTRGLW